RSRSAPSPARGEGFGARLPFIAPSPTWSRLSNLSAQYPFPQVHHEYGQLQRNSWLCDLSPHWFLDSCSILPILKLNAQRPKHITNPVSLGKIFCFACGVPFGNQLFNSLCEIFRLLSDRQHGDVTVVQNPGA